MSEIAGSDSTRKAGSEEHLETFSEPIHDDYDPDSPLENPDHPINVWARAIKARREEEASRTLTYDDYELPETDTQPFTPEWWAEVKKFDEQRHTGRQSSEVPPPDGQSIEVSEPSDVIEPPGGTPDQVE